MAKGDRAAGPEVPKAEDEPRAEENQEEEGPTGFGGNGQGGGEGIGAQTPQRPFPPGMPPGTMIVIEDAVVRAIKSKWRQEKEGRDVASVTLVTVLEIEMVNVDPELIARILQVGAKALTVGISSPQMEMPI